MSTSTESKEQLINLDADDNDNNKEIDEYLSELRLSNTCDPTIEPKFTFSTWLCYYISFILEAWIVLILETTYFMLTGWVYFSAKRKHKNLKSEHKNTTNEDGL